MIYNPSKNGAEMWPVHTGAPSTTTIVDLAIAILV
jgi:hypothetical protein